MPFVERGKMKTIVISFKRLSKFKKAYKLQSKYKS